MYEQNEVSIVRRVLWLILWFILIVAVLWVAIWFVFFRNDSKKTNKTPTSPNQSQSKQTPSGNSTPAATTNTNDKGTRPTNAAAPSTPTQSSTTTQPTQLANTGAGDVLAPAATAMIIGSSLYYIRLRRKAAE